MLTIKNKRILVKNGVSDLNKRARRLVLESLEYALNAVDPKRLMETKLFLRNSSLEVDGFSFDLEKFGDIFVVGGGKASGLMAEALEQKLGTYITNGLVNVPKGGKYKTEKIKLCEANHPIPDRAGVTGTRRMLQIAEEARKGDLMICLISGGGSSLMPLPRGEISLEDVSRITDALLKSGATINEINTVRKHISDFKGGWLAEKAYPAAVLNLILSDVVGDPLDSIASGPTVPDTTTFGDAVKALKKHHLWKETPASIRKILSQGQKGLVPETPKRDSKAFEEVRNIVIGNNRCATLAACESLKSSGLNTFMLTSTLEGEARHIGTMLASIAHEVITSGHPIPKPAGIVAGGETTVTVTGKGRGGRNQEIGLAAMSKMDKLDGVVLASLTTDGVDGPTDAAGAIVDGKTMSKALKINLNHERFLAENDSYHFFSELEDLIFTGATGTNVNDVSVIVVL